KTKIAEWKARARAFIGEIYLIQASIAAIEKKYFDNNNILWKASADELQRMTEWLEQLISTYNKLVAYRLQRYYETELFMAEKPEDDAYLPVQFRSGFKIDLDEIKRAIQPHVADRVATFVKRAKAQAMDLIGEGRAAREMLLHSTSHTED